MKKKKTNGRIAIAEAQPVFDRLIAMYGTKAKVAKALGIHKQGFLNPNKTYIHYKTYNRARELLAAKEDELSTSTHVPLEVVDKHQLALILRKWVVQYVANRPEGFDDFSGPTQVIAERSGKSIRVVSGYINETHFHGTSTNYVDVKVADELLIAIDETNAFYDGRLPIIPNPLLSMERWFERMETRGCI